MRTKAKRQKKKAPNRRATELLQLLQLKREVESLALRLSTMLLDIEVEDLVERAIHKCVESHLDVKAARRRVAIAKSEVDQADADKLSASRSQSDDAWELKKAKQALADGSGTQAAVNAADKALTESTLHYIAAVLKQGEAAQELFEAEKALRDALNRARKHCLDHLVAGEIP